MCECAHIRRDKMKNTRTTQQTKIKKCMRWTASGLLLAVLFVLVFAGTLSGAFGIEKIADAGSPIDVSSISVSGTNIGNAFNTNNDSNKSKFYLSGNGDIASHFGYNTSANGGWGFTDWNARSNNPQVYWLEFKFSGDALTAVRQGRVSYYASAKGDFSDGTNDEYGMAISYMGDHSAPQAGWVDGSGEKWKTTNNLVEYQGFSNDNSKTFTFGQIGSFAERYAISTTATGIRLIFAAIPDGNIDGGFKEINFTLYMKPNDTVSSTGTTFDVSDGFYGENYKISANSTSNWSNLSDNESGNGIKTSGTKEYSGSDPLNVGEGHNYDFNIGITNSGVAITYMSKPDKYSYTGSIDVSIVIPAYTTSVSISADVYTSTTAHRSRSTIFNTFYVPKNDSTATVSILHSDNQVFPNTAKSVSSAMAKHEKSDDSNNKCGLAVVEHLAYSSTITTDASDQAKTIKVRLTLNASKEDQGGSDDEQFAFALLTNLQISFKGQYFVELNSNTSPNAANRQTFVYGTNKSLPTRSGLGWTNGDNTFTGWGTVSDGVVKYANGYNTVNGEFTNKPGATIKLYAIWVGSDFSHYDDRAADSTWGSKNNPFLITSDEEWKNLIDIVNGARDPVNSVTGTYYETAHSTAASDTKFSNCYFVLTSNLGSQDEPIGLTSIGLNTSNYFAGNIRGGNGGNFNNTNTVRVLYINIYQESDYCGLFGYAKNASISFLEVSGAIDANDDYVGGILGYGDNVSVSNCKNDIDITSVTYDDLNNPTYYNYIGGIAGYLVNGAISNCANSGSIGGASNVGGIVGSAQASVSYCENIGGVITGNDYVGGIVGTLTSTVDHCYDVAGQRSVRQANGRIGAITGSGGTVTDSWAINEVARTGQTTTNVSTAHRTVSASTFNVSPLLNLSDTTNGAWTDIITQNIDGFKISGKTTNGTYLYLNNGSNSIVSPDKMDGDTAVNSITNTAITKTSGIGFALYYGANKNSNINAELRDISTSISNLTYDGKLHSATNISLPTGYDPIANFYFVRDNNGNPTGNPTDDGRTNAGNYYVISEARFAVSGTTYVVGRKVISNNWVISKRAITLKQTHFEYFYGENVTAKAEYNNVVNGHIVKMTTPYVNFYAGIDSNLGYKDYVVTSTDVKIYIDGTDTDVSKNYSIAEATITIRINEGDFGVQGTDDIANNPWGSVNNPYLIRTQTQLEGLAQIVASGDARNSVRTADFPYVKAQVQQNKQDFANCYFVISANIGSASAPVSLTPIGRNATNCFAGTIYGAGNSIKIIYLNINQGGESNVGLFGYTNGASISYIKTDGSIVGGESTGGIVGCAEYTEIFDCSNSAEINGKSETGGIIGYTDNSAIQNCTNNGVVKGADNVGGIVGKICAGKVENCTNSGSINAQKYVGGIIGNTDGVTVTGCDNNGIVSASGDTAVGGIVGGLVGDKILTITKCNNNATVKAESANGVAGIIGHTPSAANKLSVSGCKNTADITGSLNVGGIGGRIETKGVAAEQSLLFRNCYNTGKIAAKRASDYGTVGGIVGYLYANNTTNEDVALIIYCFSSGEVNSVANINQGSIVGNATSNNAKSVRVAYCYTTNTQAYGISGKNAGTIDNTNYIIRQGTSIPSLNYGGSVFLYSSGEVSPAVISGNSYAVKTWENIVDFDINGLKITQNVAVGKFFVSDNGASGTDLKYVKPTIIQGFSANSGDVTACYSSDLKSNIYAHVEAISIDNITNEYDEKEHDFSSTKYPNTAQNAAENTPTVYTSVFGYLGQRYGEIHPIEVDVYTATIKIKIGDQVVGVKNNATSTITQRQLSVTNVWTSASEHSAGDSIDYYIFSYNAIHQGIKEIKVAIVNTATMSAIPNGVCVIGAYQDTVAANSTTAYVRTVTLTDTRNYVISSTVSKYDDFNSSTELTVDASKRGVNQKTQDGNFVVTYSWKILPYDIGGNFSTDPSKTKVWFGGIAGDNGLIVGNQLTSVISGTTRGGDSVNVDYYPLQVDVKGKSGVQQVLVYSRHNYSHDNFILYVQYNDGSVVAIEQGTEEYNLTTLEEPSSDKNYAPVDTSIIARGKVNFTGDITRYYTALYSDFGGDVTSAGWGSTNNPYVIDRSEYLLRLSQIVNGGMAWNSVNNSEQCYAPQTNATAKDRSYAGAYFSVGAEIKMDGYVSTDGVTNFLPIGRIDNSTSPAREFPFSGTFDGNGNTIDYIYNTNDIRKDYIGLFGYTDGATITNFTLNCTSGEISGNDYVGFVVGYAKNSTISDVKCEYGKKVNGNDYVGGVAGKAEGTTIKCSEGNRVYNGSVQGREYVGGIVGMWIVTKAEQIGGSTSGQASITPVGRSEVDGFRYVGGLVGYLDASGCDLLQFKPSFDNGTYKENNVTYNNLTVQGTEYVGALFGVLIGNGYHKEVGEKISTAIIIDAKKDNNDKAVPCVHNVNLNLVNYGTGDNIVAPKVVGGLIGYIESAGLIFNTSYNTKSITFDFGVTTPSVLGGVVGILGKNATIETYEMKKPNGETLSGGFYPITNDVAFGTSKAFGTFVGGIAGFVSSQAGTAYETSTVGTTYIFGNAVHLVNAAEIYATGFAGGLFGAMGNVNSTGDVNSTLLSGIGEDTDLFAVLTTGVRKGHRATTNLGVAPSVSSSPFVNAAAGQMQNTKNVSVTGSYVGGLIGYVGDKVTLTLKNKTLSAKLEDLSIFSGSSLSIVSIHGSYAGGLVGYLSASAHRFEYIAVQAQLGDTENPNYQYVGGLVGYMANGTIEHCVATTNNRAYNATTDDGVDNFKGADFVGGLVGYVLSATINNSFTSGFNFASTSGTKGGIIGAGQQPNISSSWTIYVAQSGATYENASKNQYGKYISFDDDIDNYNVDSITEAVFKFAGFGGATTTLDFKVKVPNKNSDNKIENKQLVFYDASGDDEVTKNYLGDDYNSINDELTFSLDAESGTSMQVYVKKIQFVNIPKHNTSGDDSAKAVVKEAYRKPSTSDRYDVIVNTAVFDITGTNPTYQILSISGVVLFNGVIVGTTNKTVGNFSEDFTPGSVETPYTISNITEWNNFATAVKNGNSFNDEDGQKHVRLLADLTGVTSANLAGASGKPFAGTFDGNGHTISIGTISSAAAGTSLFPYANGATFKNLTVTGTITSTASGIAGFVGSAGGSLTFENCKNQVAITGGGNLGGLVGETYADTNSANNSFTYTFVDCVNEANIEGSNVKDTSGVGGIVGNVRTGGGSDAVDSAKIQSKVDLESCRNKGNITGKYNVAGIFGREGGNATVKNCANTGNITAYGADGENGKRTSGDDTYAAGIGGLITDNAKIDVFASYNKGNVLGWGNKAGGILAADCSYDQSGSTSKIYYCYNTGNVTTGGSSPQTFSAANALRSYGGMAGGILGGMVNADIQYCYNTGEITANGIIGVEFNWTYRLGGIVGYSDGVSNSSVKYTKIIKNCYNVGIIRVGARGTAGDVGVGVSPILGSHVNTSSDSYSLPVMANNYSLKDCVRHKPSSGNEWVASARAVKSGSNSNTQWEVTANIEYINQDIKGIAGKIVESVADMTALNTSGNELQTTRTTSTSGYEALGFSSQIGALGNIEGTDGGYIFVYGCLPQLAVFALDTKNGLAMTSKGYGQDLYGEYVKQSAGDQFNPYIIKDGIDLMGLQALVEAGYDFDGKYIEFADGTNNLDKDVVMSVDMSTTQATGYTFTSQNGSGKKGKSYHLYTQGAIFNDAAYNKWSEYNYYATTGGMAKNATLDKQNMLPIGRGDTSFKGTLIGSHMVQYSSLTAKEQEAYSGKKYNLTNGNYVETENGTYVLAGNGVVSNLRIASDTYGGLFAKAENATIAYVGIAGNSFVRAYAIDGKSMAGGIVALALGSTTFEHCSLEGAAQVEAYGNESYAGGIVGVADTKQSNAYNAGTILTISGCYVDTSGMVESTNGYIGGIVGYIGGDVGAKGKANTVRIENCAVIEAKLQAVAGSEDSHHIGGIIGYGSSYVPAYITGCEVGQVTDKSVNINGEYALGGIAGAMSNAVGGFIDSCSVGAGTTITRTKFGSSVSEDGKYGTAIGGLVGYTEAYITKQVTTTFSGENTFAGTINVSVETDNSNDKAANIGGIVGDMAAGANFASGSVVTVSGTISIGNAIAATNIGGVAGRTNTATFIGKFDVHPTMTSPLAQNVGGFIGKNAGATYVLADISRATDTTLKGTTITIGSTRKDPSDSTKEIYSGSISAASNVGGIIGLNSAGSVFGIGSNNVDGTNYNKGTLQITIYATITGTGDYVGGIVGLNESTKTDAKYGVVSIVRGVIVQNGAISGASYVGGIVGYDNGVLETGGATADSSFSADNQKLITALSITNKGNVKGGVYNDKTYTSDGNYVGGFIGGIDEPRNDQTATSDDVDIAGTFTNDGLVEGGNYVGGLIGYVGKGVTIGTKNDVPTEFKNSKNVVGQGNYIGGSIGLLLGTIKGASTSALVKFENGGKQNDGTYVGNVDGKAYVGGSIGVIAGNVEYAQFINKSDNLTVASADTAVGGSVGYLGVPNTLKDKDEFKNISISVQNSHFEANGTLTVSGTSTGSVVTETGGVGGAIGVIGSNVTTWSGNTYYARGNVTAGGINNVGGIIGLIKAANITISNMLAYGTTVSGATNVGGIVGATTGADTQIVSAYAIEGNFTGTVKGGIIGHAQNDTVASTSYWVKGYANEEIAGYDVEHLDNLGFTTGTEQTGWFFLYANDANGTGDLGKINTKHSTAAVNNNAPSGAAEASEVQADDAELKYWKRIADAYTASERANGEDDNAKNPLTSTIVKGFGAPQKGTLYATATAALVSSSGYYMYVATSGKVKPTIEYGNVDNTTLGYLISVNTVKNGGSATTADDTTEQSVDTAGNVAVFYRKITKGEDLVYNGYYRNPIIGLDDVGSYNGVITLDDTGEATVSDYAEKYIYTATTITKDSDNNVSETVFDKPSDPGTYTPTIKIFYVDASGKARLVGGHLGLAWTIKTRELTATFSSESQRTYGDKQDEEGSVDKTITITNIAPNFGKTVPIQVTVSAGEESTTFTWKGSAATKTENGITLTFDALSAGEPLSEKDKSATSAEDLASDSNTYTLVCKIFFKEAKSYSIVVSDGSSQDNKVERYTIKDGTGTFTVNKATLTFQRVSGKPASSAFDGTPKTTEWEVTGFKYQDGDKELAAFLPQFNLQYKNASSASSVNLYSGDKLQDGGINGPTISIGVTAGSKVNFALSGADRKGEYWISFDKSEAGNYKFEGLQDLKFNIVEVQITVSCSPSNGSKTYDKQAATITITFVASVPSNSGVTDFTGIDNYEQFIGKYFQITGEGSNAKFTVDKPNGTGKKTTVSWKITTGVNADTYTFTPELKSATKTEFEENCSWLLGDSTYQYKIKPRQLTLKATQTGTSPYTYTYDTYHHGLNEVSLDSQNGEKGLISGDTVKIAISGSVSKTLTFTSGGSQSAGISTIDAGTYTANFALTGNGNYTLSTSSIKSMSWTINQYEVKIVTIGLSGSRPYDGTATTPTITITGVSGSNGTYTYNQDTFTIAYSITKDGTTLANGDKLKNAGRYEIKVGNGNGSIKAHRTNSSSTDTSKNYKFSDKNSTATYEITPLSISIEWNYPTTLVYTGNNQMISIKSITLSDANNTTSRTLEMSSNSVDSGCGNDKLTFTLSGGGTDAGSDHTTTATLSSVKGNTDGIDSIPENYVLDGTATSGTFTIAQSKLKIAYASGTASKVYDGDTNVTNNSFTFSVSSTNGGANGSDDMFDKAMTYDNKNVGTDKNVTFTYSFKSGNSNYEYIETNKSQTVSGKGEITPLDIKVILNKLRNNKATRTFNGNAYYGGQAGASGSANSATYRSGEGFTLSGVIPGDSVNVIAEYKEADEKNRAMFDCYVNNVYKADDDTYKIASANTYFKKLVFTMTGDDAQNYTFNVYTGNKAYSEKSSTAGVTQTLTVYDSRSNVDGQKNVTTAPTIYIEITVKTYKVEYAHTAQSYANADNTYNTDWQRVVASNVPDGVTVTVSNGWMFADGKDHSDSEQAEKKQYTGYTTIRGSQNSVILGAKISGQNGMELNYKMSNQPILTIGYFVAQGDEFEIGSAASLMIASYYWTIAQNKDNPDFNQELVAGSKWHTVVSAAGYNGEYKKPSDAPEGISDDLTSWDDYFAAFEEITGKNIFLNETGVSGEDGNWGYYEETETSSSISYTKFKLVRNFSGVLTESDIATLNAFFRVYNKTTQQYESVEWGYGGTYIANFLKSSVSSTLTALGSVFMSVENAATPCEFDGDGYVIEYLNIMGYGKSNVGFFDIVGSNSVVKNLHLRNVTINANQGNVGGIAGSVLAAAEAASESSIANVSFHGTINVDVPTTNPTNGVVGGLVGNSARAIDGAIVLGTITANGAASVGGVVGVTTASISNVVSLMQVTAYSGTVGAFTATQDATVTNSFHMTNAVWLKGTEFVNVVDKNKSYNELMNGSISGYGTSNKYYYAGEMPSTKGTYDVLADVKLTKLDAKGSENEANARESMRLKDLVYVYLLMYSLTEDTDSLTESTGSPEGSTGFTVKVYKLSPSSWLVGNADGTSAKPVAIANKQNVSLLRQLPFATFTLKTNVTVSISNTFAGAFFGTVESEKNDGVSLGYKITCNKTMFEAYADGTPSCLTT